MSLAKGLAGGVPIGCMVASDELSKGFAPGSHASTFGGNPLACAAAVAVLEALPDLRPRAEELGRRLRARLEAIAPRGSDVRGLGPMLAVELPERSGEETTRITTEARERGLVLLSCGIYGNVIRLLPPLTIGDEELERGLDILEACLAG
jgi:4-aminobutyrate aminotransferase-like enzyme